MKITVLITWVSLLILAAGCSSSDKDQGEELILGQTTLLARALNVTYEVSILSGSGYYSARIDNPEIAEIEINTTWMGSKLSILTKTEGEARITVRDTRTRKSAECSLTVKQDQAKLEVVNILYGIDADNEEVIRKDLIENQPYPVGSYFTLDPPVLYSPVTGSWSIFTADVPEPISGAFSSEAIEFDDFPYSFQFVELKEQVINTGNYMRFTIDLAERSHIYDLILVYGFAPRSSQPAIAHCRFYEDLTEYYQTKYPDGGVRGVAWAYLCGQ